MRLRSSTDLTLVQVPEGGWTLGRENQTSPDQGAAEGGKPILTHVVLAQDHLLTPLLCQGLGLPATKTRLRPRSLLVPPKKPSPQAVVGPKGVALVKTRGEAEGPRGGGGCGAARGAEEERGLGRSLMRDRQALTFALFVRGLGASRRHLFAGCVASRLITLPAA